MTLTLIFCGVLFGFLLIGIVIVAIEEVKGRIRKKHIPYDTPRITGRERIDELRKLKCEEVQDPDYIEAMKELEEYLHPEVRSITLRGQWTDKNKLTDKQWGIIHFFEAMKELESIIDERRKGA